jgi:hypothetical protein
MRRAQPWIVSNRELKTSVKITIVQNQRLNYFTFIAEQHVIIDEHVKAVNALPSPVRNLELGYRLDMQQIFPSRAGQDPVVNFI